MVNDLNVQYLKEILKYNPCTGLFTWKVRGSGIKTLEAGCVCPQGYIIIRINYKNYRAHRLAWLYIYGKWPLDQIDHMDRNKTNNSIFNLRDVSLVENNSNKMGGKYLKGVYKPRKTDRFGARIVINRIHYHIGMYDTEQQAHEAFMKKYKLTYGTKH